MIVYWYNRFRNILIFRHPERTKNNGLVFLEPFTDDVWLLMILFGIVSTILLWLFTIFEQNLYQLSFANENPMTSMITLKNQIYSNNLKLSSPVITNTNTRNHLKCITIINKLLDRCKSGVMGLCIGGYHHLFKDKSKTLSILFESFLFYTGLICQQGIKIFDDWIQLINENDLIDITIQIIGTKIIFDFVSQWF